jgi:hypothetical protein
MSPPEARMTSDDQWHRIKFPKGEVASGAMGGFVMDSLLPATEEQEVDLRTVAIFEVDDSAGGKYLCLSPAAFAAFHTLALAYGAQPCDRPAPESSLLYGNEWSPVGSLAVDFTASPRTREHFAG